MKSYGAHALVNVEKCWRGWWHERRYDIAYQEAILNTTLDQVLKLDGEEYDRWEGIFLDMRAETHENERAALQLAQAACPIGFFKPSWEQAQVLNAWHPDYSPDAPEGYRSVCNFTSNRGGKSAVMVIDTLLWITPNDPAWQMFQPMEDTEGRKHGNDRGTYRVLPRPNYEAWRRTGKLLPPHPGECPKGACEIWQGVENDDHWEKKIGKEYLKWAPKDWIGKRSDGGTAIFKQERMIQSRHGHTITGKTYNSDAQAWAGHAVWRVNMDEGFSKTIFDEALLRVEGNGLFHWAYTPAEARNIGERARLASECYRGKHKLVGHAKFFDSFQMAYIPDWIMTAEKKNDDMARLSNEGEMGKVRMGIKPFFESSPTVFSNFDRERNVLPVDGGEVLLAIRGEVPARWTEVFGKLRADSLQWSLAGANLIRGMDEGLANPTACVWTAICRTGEYVTFREWEASGLSVSERCREIIERSANTVECVNPEAIIERRRYRERVTEKAGLKINRTFADSKMFRRDPEKPQDDWTENYRRAGLRLERATNIGPAARCDYANDMLRGEANRKHFMSDTLPGPRAYVTRDCMKLIERFENYLWQQIATGQRTGEFTDKPESKDDHTLDAYSYALCSKLKWHDPIPAFSEVGYRVNALTGAIVR